MSNTNPHIVDEAMDEKNDPQENDQKSTTVQMPSGNQTEPEGKEVISPTAAYFKLWSFALPLDVALRVLAAICFVGAGTAEPLMTIFFGNLVNLYNNENPRTPAQFRAEINKNALYLVYLFIGKLAVSSESISTRISCLLSHCSVYMRVPFSSTSRRYE